MALAYTITPHELADLEKVVEALEEAHDTHIWSEDDDHGDRCGYCDATWTARQTLKAIKSRQQ